MKNDMYVYSLDVRLKWQMSYLNRFKKKTGGVCAQVMPPPSNHFNWSPPPNKENCLENLSVRLRRTRPIGLCWKRMLGDLGRGQL